MTTEVFVFDLDGTLVDSLEGITASVNFLLKKLDLPGLPKEKVATYVGEGARTLFSRLLQDHGLGDRDDLFEEFITHYTEESPSVTPFFEGAREKLEGLSAQGYERVLFTNKPLAATRTLLSALKAEDMFSLVVCPENCRHRKPHPEGLHRIAQYFGRDSSRLMMVGDALPDARLAWMSGIPFLPVSFGYGEKGFYKSLPHLPPINHWEEFRL